IPCALSTDIGSSCTHTAHTEIYTLSLHDALPIWLPNPATSSGRSSIRACSVGPPACSIRTIAAISSKPDTDSSRMLCSGARIVRSEEHTSELQSRENLVCRLLLEKKKGVRDP